VVLFLLAGGLAGTTAMAATRRCMGGATIDVAAATATLTTSATPVAKPAVLLVSRYAGASRELPRARAAMAGHGLQILDEVPVERHERLTEWLSRPNAGGPPLIVAAGGDGTVGAAADHVAGTAAVLGVLPLGTSNDFARSLKIPTDPVRAANLLAHGTVRAVDVGQLVVPGQRPRHFVHAATAGVNVNFARLATQASLRRRFGRFTYLIAGAHALRAYRGFTCELRDEHQRRVVDLVQLSVINAPVFGGFLSLRVPGAHLDDGALDVIAVERLSWRAVYSVALQSAVKTHRAVEGVHTFSVTTLRVDPGEQLDVALDGEVVGRLPAEFRVAREALRVMTPPAPSSRTASSAAATRRAKVTASVVNVRRGG
jgi:YegS/Rv2252/BmrU family lipid kinase